MLAEKVEDYGSNVWLVNTGWSAGQYGVGKRMSLKTTRSILDAIHDGSLEKEEYEIIPGFNLQVPKNCKEVDSKILNPINVWKHKSVFNLVSKKLAGEFIDNFEKYIDGTPENVVENGGPNLEAFK